MILTSQQVKERLRIGDTKLRNLVNDGLLKPVNERKPGAKKFFAKFDSKAVDEYRRTMRDVDRELPVERKAPTTPIVPAPTTPIVPAPSPTPIGIMSTLLDRMTRVEEKLDKLLSIWS